MIAIRPYLSRRVEVRSLAGQTERSDQGVLKHMDEQLVVIENAKGEIFVFPVCNVRLVKILPMGPDGL